MLYAIAILMAILCLIEFLKLKKGQKLVVNVNLPTEEGKKEAAKKEAVEDQKASAAMELSDLGGRPL